MFRQIWHRVRTFSKKHGTWDDVLGFAGSGTLVSAYYMSKHTQDCDATLLDTLNFLGASAVAVNCYKKAAFSPMALEIVWASIALTALYQNYPQNNKRIK